MLILNCFLSIQIARDLMQVIVYLKIFLLIITYSFHCDDLVEKQEIKQWVAMNIFFKRPVM